MKFLPESKLEEKLIRWNIELGLDQYRDLQLLSPALLVLDMQNEFLSESGQMPVWGGPAIIPHVKRLLNAFRTSGYPVFFTKHLCIEPYRHQGELQVMDGVANPGSFLREGCAGAKIHEELRPRKDEQIITKYRYSAFYDTPLDTFLKVNRINEVIITGVATNICCETTAHDAFFRGYRVLFTIDGTGGTDESAHLASIRNIKLSYGKPVTVESIVTALTL